MNCGKRSFIFFSKNKKCGTGLSRKSNPYWKPKIINIDISSKRGPSI